MSSRSQWWLAALALVAIAFALTPASAHDKSESPHQPEIEVQRTDPPDVSMALLEVEARRVGDYLVWQAAEDQLLAVLDANGRFLASLYYVPPPPAPPVIAPRAYAPPPTPVVNGGGGGGFLDCVRNRESRGNYSIHNAGGSGASGAYQFMPGTWNSIAQSSGRSDLVGVDPAQASPGDQDAMARALYAQQGADPWGGGC